MDDRGTWTRYFVYRTEVVKTTWMLRLALVGLMLGIGFATRDAWIPALGRSLVCEEQPGLADVLVLDNLDADYLLFERAAALQAIAGGTPVLVVSAGTSTGHDAIALGTVELMARVAGLRNWRMIAVRDAEPVTLGAARQVRDVLSGGGIQSVALITPRFRSRRSALVYHAVLDPTGVVIRCVPVLGTRNERTWTATWHGIQEVALQTLKLAYYRLSVLPTLGTPPSVPARGPAV